MLYSTSRSIFFRRWNVLYVEQTDSRTWSCVCLPWPQRALSALAPGVSAGWCTLISSYRLMSVAVRAWVVVSKVCFVLVRYCSLLPACMGQRAKTPPFEGYVVAHRVTFASVTIIISKLCILLLTIISYMQLVD